MENGPVNVAEFEPLAAAKLERGPWDYFAGGAGDEVTLRENVAAWGSWRLRPRVLNDVEEVSAGVEVLGKPVSVPVLVAPVAYQRMAHPDGEAAMAAGAAAAGTAMCLSTLSTTRPADVAAAAPDGRHWFQLYAFKDEGVTRALTEEAIEAGFEAVLVTADAPPGGNRERDRRNRFTLPEELGTPSLTAAVGGERSLSIEDTFALMNHALTWADVEDLASECGVPVLVKGVLTAEDAELALEHGAAGVVVSNHGGRQLDRSLATAEALPEIAETLDGRGTLLVDGGIRRGVDVATALALGADAVLVGRPAIWGLAAAGGQGVARVLEMLREELELTLGLCGCTSPSQLTRAHLRRAPTASVYSV
ncbi:MAG TPA: alpha-hydroxy acid oxidase [Solirubrobacterales bacterium]|nr:alpha-hydroxy acid oxidase [Solirubrobacterales bacterium]